MVSNLNYNMHHETNSKFIKGGYIISNRSFMVISEGESFVSCRHAGKLMTVNITLEVQKVTLHARNISEIQLDVRDVLSKPF